MAERAGGVPEGSPSADTLLAMTASDLLSATEGATQAEGRGSSRKASPQPTARQHKEKAEGKASEATGRGAGRLAEGAGGVSEGAPSAETLLTMTASDLLLATEGAQQGHGGDRDRDRGDAKAGRAARRAGRAGGGGVRPQERNDQQDCTPCLPALPA